MILQERSTPNKHLHDSGLILKRNFTRYSKTKRNSLITPFRTDVLLHLSATLLCLIVGGRVKCNRGENQDFLK